MQTKLKEAFENNLLEERKDEVLEIFSEVAQEYMQDIEYLKGVRQGHVFTGIKIQNPYQYHFFIYIDNFPGYAFCKAYLLEKWPDVFENCYNTMQWTENHSWLLPFRFILISDYKMDDFELLKLINLQKEVKESCPSKKIIDKLISDQGIKSFLIERMDKPLSEHLLTFCRRHPSLEDFISLPWDVISKEIQPEPAASNLKSSCVHEEEILKSLWEYGHPNQVPTLCTFQIIYVLLTKYI